MDFQCRGGDGRRVEAQARGKTNTRPLKYARHVNHCRALNYRLYLGSFEHLPGGTIMKTSCEFLDAVKAKHCLVSDYALSKKLDVGQSCVTHYRKKRSFLDDDMAVKVAELLGLEVAYVLACVHAERAERSKNATTMKVWLDIASRYAAGLAAVAFCTLLPAPQGAFAVGFPSPSADNNKYTLCEVRKRRRGKPFLLGQFWRNLRKPSSNR